VVITALQMMASMIHRLVPTHADVSDVPNAALQARDPVMLSAAGAVGQYAANHMDVRAIAALTESGATALWMSRIRADIPIFALTRHAATQRRVPLYRGVVPVAFDVTHTESDRLSREIFRCLRDAGGLEHGDLVIITKGAITGVSGHTDSLTVLPLEF